MILEHALLPVRPDRTAKFEATFDDPVVQHFTTQVATRSPATTASPANPN